YPKYLKLDEGASIGHFTVAVNLDRMVLGKNVHIGRSNWITGFPTQTESKHFAHDEARRSELIIDDESAITKHHHIDCTNSIHIGHHVTIAGYYSQLLTHSIDVYAGRQDSHPISIGDYCFVSTGVKILGGATLPEHSVLAAGAVLNKPMEESYSLYGGVPAKRIKGIPKEAKYMNREKGFVY
ncbi:MAG: acyltransferase, partial [Bacteroidaceae bacterium]